VYSDHPWDSIKVAVVQRWSLFRGLPPPPHPKKIFYLFKILFPNPLGSTGYGSQMIAVVIIIIRKVEAA
jgi:hypothetical protein